MKKNLNRTVIYFNSKAMKQILTLAMITFLAQISYGQNAQTTPNGTLIANQNSSVAMPSSSIFEVRSNTKGMLPPRMTTNRINQIVSPTIGLMAYDIDVKCLKIYNGSEWECANANIVAATPISSSFAFRAMTDNTSNSEAIVADANENTISVGSFKGGVTFGSNINQKTLTSFGEKDGFIAKNDKDGNLIWATQIGGAADQEIFDVALDNSGNICVIGYLHYSTNFYSTNNTSTTFSPTGNFYNIFIAKYNSSGVLIWKTASGSSGNYNCRGNGINFDNDGNVVATGYFEGTVAFDAIALNSVANSSDIFIAKINGTTGAYMWVQADGGTNSYEWGSEIVCDNLNNIYVFGAYSGTATFGTNANLTSRGSFDFFLSKYNTNGGFGWVQTAGGTSEDYPGGVAYSSATNSIFICGSYKNTLSFGIGLGTNSLTSVGDIGYDNGFLAKYDTNGNILWSAKQGSAGSYTSFTNDIAIDGSGNPYITGTIHYNSYFYSANSNSPFYLRGFEYDEPFIAKYTSSAIVQWSILATDGYSERVRGICFVNNTAFVIGNFGETTNFGYQQLHSSSSDDLFIWRYSE